MQKKLTVTIDEEVYEGLREVIGPRKISRFIEELVRPHVTKKDIYAAYKEMAADWFIGEKCICNEPMFRVKLSVWKRIKDINANIISQTESAGLKQPNNINKSIKESEKNTCRSITRKTNKIVYHITLNSIKISIDTFSK